MAINKHGLKMTGLKAASGATQDYGYYSDQYVELFYNRETGEIWAKHQVSLGHNTWTVYDDPAVLKIGNVWQHLTMQAIADKIAEAVRLAELCA